MLSIAAEVKPDEITKMLAAIEEVAANLAAKPITEDELNRARAPLLATLAKNKAGNEWWSGQLAGATWDSRRFEKPRTGETHLNSVTLADLQRAATTYLKPERAWRLVVEPRAATTPASTE